MLLVDTSVWVDFFRGETTKEVRALASSLEGHDDVCTCGIVMTEILQGIRSEREYRRIKKLLHQLVYLPVRRRTYLVAAGLYRAARSRGVTIRKTIDCIIAACAIEHDVALLHRDTDFDRIAGFSRLKMAGREPRDGAR